MTSNLGTEGFQQHDIGFRRGNNIADQQRINNEIEAALKRAFRPELLNRIDDTIIFHPLTAEHLSEIVSLLIKDVESRLLERKITIEISKEAKEWLVNIGYDPVYGARPLRRAIQRHIENPLSSKILQGEFSEGEHIAIDMVENALTFNSEGNTMNNTVEKTE